MTRRPRFVPGSTDLPGCDVEYVDAASFASAFSSIFVDGAYDVPEPPTHIVDGGANIGLAVLRWKQLYPEVIVDAYEPDPEVFETLKRNVGHLPGVQLHQAALASYEGTARFWSEGADAGRLSHRGALEVPTVRIAEQLHDVDLLKLDIEGGEADVLSDCRGRLDHVRYVFVEWHSICGRDQRLQEIIGVLEDAGFRLHLQPELASPAPFSELKTDGGMDNRVNIFAWRDDRAARTS